MSAGTLTTTEYLQKQIDQQKQLMTKVNDEVDELKKQAVVKTRILEEMTSTLGAMAERIEELYGVNPQCDL